MNAGSQSCFSLLLVVAVSISCLHSARAVVQARCNFLLLDKLYGSILQVLKLSW